MSELVYIGKSRGVDAFTLVDDEDIALVRSRRWSLGGAYVVTTPRGDESAPLHRQILGLDKRDTRVVHHINENPLDNRRANLRICENKIDHGMQPHPLRDARCGKQGKSRWVDDFVREIKEWAA